jgi:hypothetical protein
MAFDERAWRREYMRAYRRGKRRRPIPGRFDKKAWSREYMRGYMRERRARQYAERDAEVARLLEIEERERRIADGRATMDDLQAMLDEIKAKFGVTRATSSAISKPAGDDDLRLVPGAETKHSYVTIDAKPPGKPDRDYATHRPVRNDNANSRLKMDYDPANPIYADAPPGPKTWMGR